MKDRTLSHYRIVDKLGEGGMGVVYRAADTKLGREVALKILPADFARDPERLARFEREARLLASLNHPNIAILHGFEQAEDLRFLVMELVPGETLAEHLARGPLAVEEIVFLFKQMAEALEAAHEKGIIHRDLKPANIKLTPEGKVKVLDFGLAKALAGEVASGDPSQSPTATREVTGGGVILGTAAYMSPEQARGKPLDRRTDVWSFGCVLFEALTGRKAFARETVSDTIARILEREPDWEALPAATPQPIGRLLRRCLEKDFRRRLRYIDPVEFEEDVPTAPGATDIRSGRRSALAGVAFSIVISAVTGIAVWNLRPQTEPVPEWSREPVTLSIPIQESPILGRHAPSVSPDGRRIVFVAPTARGAPALWIRSLDSYEAALLEGTSGSTHPFWSPDSRSIGFFAEGKLKRMDVASGAAQTLWNVPGAPQGGSWSQDGVILFSQRYAISQIPAAGGEATPVVRVDPSRQEDSLRFPDFLPDGRHFLFVARSGRPEQSSAYVGSLDSKDTQRMFPVLSKVTYVPPGFLLFARDGSLLAQPFDPVALRTEGDPLLVVQDVGQRAIGLDALFSTSRNGVLAYMGARPSRTELRWFDRRGTPLGPLGPTSEPYNLRISPEGNRVAVDDLNSRTGDRTIWILDSASGRRSRLTFTGSDWMPVWSPDGKQILFSSTRDGPSNVYRKPVDGSGIEEALLQSKEEEWPQDWSLDGRYAAYGALSETGNMDLFLLPLFGDEKPIPVATTSANEEHGRFSPDGRWIVYTSNETGRGEVYVQPIPPTAARWQVSENGGSHPRWRGDGAELFYLGAGLNLVAVEVKAGTTFEVGAARALFQLDDAALGAGTNKYDVTRDGKRFLVNTAFDDPVEDPLLVVLNWMALLER